MLRRVQPYFEWAWWYVLLWWHRGAALYWASKIRWYTGEWPETIWPKKK